MANFVVRATPKSGVGEAKIFQVRASTSQEALETVKKENPNYIAIEAKHDVGWDFAEQVAGVAASKLVRAPVPGWIALKAFTYLADIATEAAKCKRENERIVGDALAEMVAKIIK